MSYVPPHLRKKAVVVEPRRGIRFIGNATGDIDVANNTGVRYSPHTRDVADLRHTRKLHIRSVSMNVVPPSRPTTAVSHMPTKFKHMVLESGQVKSKAPKHHRRRHHTRRRPRPPPARRSRRCD